MRKRTVIAATIAIALGGAVLLVFALSSPDGGNSGERRERTAGDGASRPPPRVAAAPPADDDPRHRAESSRQAFLAALDAAPDEPPASGDPERVLYLSDIDDIKHEIYAREIESVDRLHLLDELVQTGDADTREYWNRDWSGVDDWKEEHNGFSLQRTEDGTLIFHPDPATMAMYTFYENLQPYEYDPETREFVSEIDYYGKPIRNVLKFIKDDTLVMMTISGEKVDLNIYGEGAQRP